MAENQHNDNLEQFFKANLENYSPVPSKDFWERMEPNIPAKPSFWSRWKQKSWKWAGMGLLLLSLVAVAIFWQNDRRKIAKLSEKLTKQQQHISQLEETAKVSSMPSSNPTEPIPTTDKTAKSDIPAPSSNNNSLPPNTALKTATAHDAGGSAKNQSPSGNLKIRKEPAVYPKELTGELEAKDSTTSSSNALDEAKQIISENGSAPIAQMEENDLAPQNNDSNQAPSFLAFGNAPKVYSLKIHAPSVKHLTNRSLLKPYPRFSVEVGASTSIMPLGRLFAGDTLYTGRIWPSSSGNLMLDYEIGPTLAFQAGYQFKDIRSVRMSLRYNSFPLLLRKKWAWGRRGHLEAKAGIAVNSLLDARTATDGLAVKGLKNTWLGCQGTASIAYSLSEELTLLVGPSLGFSLTPVANQKRSWEAGLGMSLRYEM